MKPTIIIDRNIPFIHGWLDTRADVHYMAAADMTPGTVRSADCLIVRTRTRCDASLLRGSRVRLIVTATIGYDHIDTDYCASAGITWSNAPGCNAASVQQYIASAIASWSIARSLDLTRTTIGIIGVGHVGSRVDSLCRALGMTTLRNDPPRAAAEGDSTFSSLAEIAGRADIITLHTPLTAVGQWPTAHLVNSSFLRSLRKKPLIINAARGGVIDEQALLLSLADHTVSGCVIDCWENEPHINRSLLQQSFIATPHIAGYSADGKSAATLMSLRTVNDFFSLGIDLSAYAPLPPEEPLLLAPGSAASALCRSYDILADSRQLKAAPEQFESFRSHYPVRREHDLTLT